MESNLFPNLSEHLLTEIVMGNVRNLEEAMQWLQTTFFYVRAIQGKNPPRPPTIVGRGGAAALDDPLSLSPDDSNIGKCLLSEWIIYSNILDL